MGLFRKIKSVKKAVSAGGNFAYVAQNVATIYSVFINTPFGQMLDTEHRLYAVAQLDLVAYTSQGQITIEEIKTAVKYAMTGTIGAGFYDQRPFSMFELTDENKLITLVMQLEVLIFCVESSIDYRTVVNQVMEHKDLISETVERTLNQEERSPLYPDIYPLVTSCARDMDFQKLVRDYQ